jgi:hypothetical protein
MTDEDIGDGAAGTGDDGHDLDKPPPGCRAGTCITCGGEKLVQVLRMAVGPIRGTELAADEVGTVLGWSTCRVCRGRGWVWMRAAPGDR